MAKKDYTYKASNIVIAKSGVQAKGENAGRAYAVGTFETEVTVKGEKRTVKKGFKAFDQVFQSGKGLTPASTLLTFVEMGVTEGYVTGSFQEGRARDPNDPSKGNFQDFSLAFIETVEEHAAFVEARKAARAAKTPQGAPVEPDDGLEPEYGEDDIPGSEDTNSESVYGEENPFV